MDAKTTGVGLLTMTAWPSFVGACFGDPGPGPWANHEPLLIGYERGQINWHAVTSVEEALDLNVKIGDVVGRGLVKTIPGRYTHIAYFAGPDAQHPMMHRFELPTPIVHLKHGVIDCFPITNPGTQ